MSVAAYATARQPSRPSGVRQEPRVMFDAIPLAVQTHPDLGRGPKDLYGALNSAANLNEDWTQQALADRLVCSVRSVIRWSQQLVAAGLLEVRRRGQGLANRYILLGPVVQRRSDRRARPQMTAWQPPIRKAPPTAQGGRTVPAGGYPSGRLFDAERFGRYGALVRR